MRLLGRRREAPMKLDDEKAEVEPRWLDGPAEASVVNHKDMLKDDRRKLIEEHMAEYMDIDRTLRAERQEQRLGVGCHPAEIGIAADLQRTYYCRSRSRRI